MQQDLSATTLLTVKSSKNVLTVDALKKLFDRESQFMAKEIYKGLRVEILRFG